MNLEGTRFPVGPYCASDRCKDLVVWAISGASRMLVNATPTPDGTVLLRDTGGPDPTARVLTVAERATKQAGSLHLSHFATCPEAKKYRKART